jgi:hypothetical protein
LDFNGVKDSIRTGLSPKIPHRSPAKSMTAGKGKEKEVAI